MTLRICVFQNTPVHRRVCESANIYRCEGVNIISPDIRDATILLSFSAQLRHGQPGPALGLYP